jgi:hypothetical protein
MGKDNWVIGQAPSLYRSWEIRQQSNYFTETYISNRIGRVAERCGILCYADKGHKADFIHFATWIHGIFFSTDRAMCIGMTQLRIN